MEKLIYTFRDLQNIGATLRGESGEVWLFDKTPKEYRYKCYSDNTTIMRRILSWEGNKRGATYCWEDGIMITFDVIIPKRLVNRACRILGIILKKDLKKIEAGRRLEGKRNPFLSGISRNNFH